MIVSETRVPCERVATDAFYASPQLRFPLAMRHFPFAVEISSTFTITRFFRKRAASIRDREKRSCFIVKNKLKIKIQPIRETLSVLFQRINILFFFTQLYLLQKVCGLKEWKYYGNL